MTSTTIATSTFEVVNAKFAIFSIMFTPVPPALITNSQVMAGSVLEYCRLIG